MGYQYTEEDIQKVLNYLRIFHPERATRQGAIEFLETSKLAAKDISKELEKLAKVAKKPLN